MNQFLKDHKTITAVVSVVVFLSVAGLILWSFGTPESARTELVIDQQKVNEVHHRHQLLKDDEMSIDDQSAVFIDMLENLESKTVRDLTIPEAEIGRDNPFRPEGGWGTQEDDE